MTNAGPSPTLFARQDGGSQSGNATLTAVLVVCLLSVFVAASLSRITSGQIIMNNDYANAQAFYAAQASLEEMTVNFDAIFTFNLTPTQGDLNLVQNASPTPNFPGFTFNQVITAPTGSPVAVPITSGAFSGLQAFASKWQLDATATSTSNSAQVHLTREFYSDEIPIFQFGIFYNGPLAFHPGPNMWFAGRVHSNSNIYLLAGGNINANPPNPATLSFSNVVTASGEIIRDWNRNGVSAAAGGWQGIVQIDNPQGVPVTLPTGSTSGGYYGSAMPAGGTSGSASDPQPGFAPNNNASYSAWNTEVANFGGNLQAHVPVLLLPLQVGGANPYELVKRGISSSDYQVTALTGTADTTIVSQSRYANKPGIRISLSDSQAELPGGTGGIRLDGDSTGTNAGDYSADGTRGYMPQKMSDGYQATRVNGFRMFTGTNYTTNGTTGNGSGIPANRQTWIKVELVTINPNTLAVSTSDVTADFLSLGVTYQDVAGLLDSTGKVAIGDSRAILCMQRYAMLGETVSITQNATAAPTPAANIPLSFATPDGTIPTNTVLHGLSTSIGVPTMIPAAAQATPVPLPVHSYYLPSGGVNPGINYVSTADYSPSMNYWTTKAGVVAANGAVPVITYNFANGNPVATVNNYPGYTSQQTFNGVPAAALPTPNNAFTAGAAQMSLEAKEFASTYSTTGKGWVPVATAITTANAGVAAKMPTGSGTAAQVLPFPIEFFDTREGTYNVNQIPVPSTTPGFIPWDYNTTGGNGTLSAGMYNLGSIPKVGVMSGVDINMANLTTFLNGGFDTKFPNGLLSTTVPTNPGWIVYVSDRRGDRNDNGVYDMEDIYGPNDNVLEDGEDAVGDNNLPAHNDTTWEAALFYSGAGTTGDANYTTSVPSDVAAFMDHQYFRRGVRLINGAQLPGGNTLSTGQIVGFTMATENPIYIIGNYNASAIYSSTPPFIVDTSVVQANLPAGASTAPTNSSKYVPNYSSEVPYTSTTTPIPAGTSLEVPASVVADAVYMLSNSWLDANSFRNPLSCPQPGSKASTLTALGSRWAMQNTSIRTAVFTGQTQGSILTNGVPNQGSATDADLDGGVHNFPRFLEDWGQMNYGSGNTPANASTYLNYSGSLINAFVSTQALGAYKNGGAPNVYNPPVRNWTFDSAFLSLNQLPPGTPLFQFVQLTGFRQTVTQEQ
jgi:hypothetical protein